MAGGGLRETLVRHLESRRQLVWKRPRREFVPLLLCSLLQQGSRARGDDDPASRREVSSHIRIDRRATAFVRRALRRWDRRPTLLRVGGGEVGGVSAIMGQQQMMAGNRQLGSPRTNRHGPRTTDVTPRHQPRMRAVVAARSGVARRVARQLVAADVQKQDHLLLFSRNELL